MSHVAAKTSQPVTVVLSDAERQQNGDNLLKQALDNGYMFHPCPIADGTFTSLQDFGSIRSRWIDDCYDVIHAIKRQAVRCDWTRDFKDSNDFRVWRLDAVKNAS